MLDSINQNPVLVGEVGGIFFAKGQLCSVTSATQDTSMEIALV